MPRASALDIDLDDVYFEELDVEKFDPNVQVKKAVEKLEKYSPKYIDVIAANFHENKWEFYSKIDGEAINFNFEDLYNIIRLTRREEKDLFLLSIKCWIVSIIWDNTLIVAKKCFLSLYSAMYSTGGFLESSREEFIKLIESRNYYIFEKRTGKFKIKSSSDAVLRRHVSRVISILTYYDKENFNQYIKDLSELHGNMKPDLNSRKVPTFSNVLKFRIYYEYWLNETLKFETEVAESEFLMYFPLIFWWEVTSIIPMRPRDICVTPKDCLHEENGSYRLDFFRTKNGVKKGEPILDPDSLYIPEGIAFLINKYKELTKNYEDEGEFLFNFTSYKAARLNLFGHLVPYSESHTNFVPKDFYSCIGRFYKHVIYKKYKVNVLNIRYKYASALDHKFMIERTDKKTSLSLTTKDAEDEITETIMPGDLRHIAIMNMFLLGYDPVEMQRLAGHVDIETQTNYQNHMQFWADSHIQQIATEFANINYHKFKETNNSDPFSVHPKAYKKYIELSRCVEYTNYGHSDETISPDQKLDIGFCKELSMPCPTFNWKHKGDYFCPYWGITITELKEKRDEILIDMDKIYEDLTGKINFLNGMLLNFRSQSEVIDARAKRKLIDTTNEIQFGIKSVGKLKGLLGLVLVD